MELIELLQKAYEKGSSDVFVVPGAPVEAKVQGRLVAISAERVMPNETEKLIREAYELSGRDMKMMEAEGDDDFSFFIKSLCRFRCNAYKQRGSLAATLRIVPFTFPSYEQLNIPEAVINLKELRSGMVLVTGTAGAGKSTTLACLVDAINASREGHIVTIEDPIEYLHSHKKSLVSQREVPNDTPSFARALRAALRQAPDVIMLGEMRDADTIQTALTAAETGHLLLSSLHTVGAAKTIDRIVDSFPGEQQPQIRSQLSMVLKAVVSQRLIPRIGGGLIPVFEVMRVTPAVQNLIRDNRVHQIDNVIYGGASQDMLSMDNELQRLYRAKQIDRGTALLYAINPDALSKRI